MEGVGGVGVLMTNNGPLGKKVSGSKPYQPSNGALFLMGVFPMVSSDHRWSWWTEFELDGVRKEMVEEIKSYCHRCLIHDDERFLIY